ncbi:MAG: sulfate reduction electron transfer complex DsrMKJOP subunit DsrO, partial [Burkholderiales bacterium]
FARARPLGEAASSAVRWGMLIDTTQCESGCDACVSACNKENGLSGGTLPTDPQWIRKLELQQESTGRKISMPMMCQHCAEPPCVEVCPTGASFKRADGIVLVDKHRCIGCRYCMMACPYKARSFVHEPVTDHSGATPRGQGTVESCTMCVHRVDQGVAPACVEACARDGHRAILFGDLNDPQSTISQRIRSVVSVKLRADLNLDPGISFVGV